MSKKILVVDDEDVVLTFLKELLENKDFEVFTAESAEKALEVLQKEKACQIVVCDIKMPGMDGLELLEKLKKERPNIVILMMTAYASWETVTAAIEKGASAYIRKPFSIEEVFQSIETAWKRFQLENENVRLKTLFSLFRISKIIKGKIDIQELCDGILSFLMERLDAVGVSIVFIDEKSGLIEKVFSSGKEFDWSSFLSGKPPGNKRIFFTSNRQKEFLPVGEKDIAVLEDQAILGMDLGILCSPLEQNEMFVGYMLVAKDLQENLAFAKSDLDLLQIISQQLAASLANLRLYLLLENKVCELQETNEKLEETKLHLIQSAKLASAGEMAAGIAHEIGNPIFSIRGTTELMLNRKERYGLNAEVLESLDVIKRQAVRAQDVANSLMTFAQKKDFQPQDLDINSIVKDTLSLLKVLLMKKNIEVSTTLEQELPSVLGDRSQISQVIFNILLNARDAMEESGGAVEIFTRVSHGDVLIGISDNGSGIVQEDINKIFFPFFTTKDVDKGHGLGLSISFGIVERHGGKIAVESVPGEKTVFTITLPAVK